MYIEKFVDASIPLMQLGEWKAVRHEKHWILIVTHKGKFCKSKEKQERSKKSWPELKPETPRCTDILEHQASDGNKLWRPEKPSPIRTHHGPPFGKYGSVTANR